MKLLRIATRRSPLALWQANYVAAQLTAQHRELRIELVEITTTGDRLLGAPLASVGGKGLFMKELEVSLLEGKADIAVHSMKDVVVDLPEGFEISAICERDDPSDAFVSNHYDSLQALPPHTLVGTCSVRRQCQIRNAYPELEVADVRGSVNTRLDKLDRNDFGAILLATAGLKRLGMADRIRQRLPASLSLPAVGQGAIGIECRIADSEVREIARALNHRPTSVCVEAERAMNRKLEGGCQLPIGALAQIENERIVLQGLVGTADGTQVVRTEVSGPVEQGPLLGERAADDLIAHGAGEILREAYLSSQTE